MTLLAIYYDIKIIYHCKKEEGLENLFQGHCIQCSSLHRLPWMKCMSNAKKSWP